MIPTWSVRASRKISDINVDVKKITIRHNVIFSIDTFFSVEIMFTSFATGEVESEC